MRHVALVLLVALVGWGARSSWNSRAIPQPPGILVAAAPEQVNLVPHGAVLQRGDVRLTTRASFELTARVLSREDYRWDEGAAIAPTDLGVGWGRMSDTAVLARMDISQSGRFMHWRWTTPPIPIPEIERSAANLHLIPASPDVLRAIHRIRPGEIVHLRGFLVDALRADGWHWNTSMTRTDTGDGACELVYVEIIEPGAADTLAAATQP